MPAEVRHALADWTAAELIAGREGLRAVPEASLHVTLVFLGSREREEADAVWQAAAEAATGVPAPVLRPRGVVGLPVRRPRVVALDLDDRDGAAGALRAAVGERCRFRPHVTLARVGRDAEVVVPPGDRTPVGPFTSPAMTLYRSHPHSRYEPLERLALEP